MHSSSAHSYPSPAMLLSVVALVVALVGTAFAAPSLTTSKITKSKVKSIADKRIDQAAPGLSVAKSVNAEKATTAERATAADTATVAGRATVADTAGDAASLNGLRANQLARATTKTNPAGFAFDETTFTDVLSRAVNAPTAGIFVISAQMNVNRSIDSANPTQIAGRATLDGAAATVEAHVRATEDGTFDESLSVTGAVAVTPGTHTVALEAVEVGSGAAFLSNLALTVQFVPFGDAGTPGVLSPEPRGQNE